jgi:predicted HicB family RNase H-like nuclease
MPESEGKMRIRLSVEEKAHADLRVLAAKSRLSMSAYCEALVLEAVRTGRVLGESATRQMKQK